MYTDIKKAKGVTLVELLVVTGLITILVSGLVLLLNPVQRIGQARDAQRKSDLAQIQRGLEIYYQDNNAYPASVGNKITGVAWGGSWSTYLPKVPQDPDPARTYVYYTPNTGACINYQCYYLYANLKSGGNDPQACIKGTGAACPNAVQNGLSNSCGGICNYGVSSTNTTP